VKIAPGAGCAAAGALDTADETLGACAKLPCETIAKTIHNVFLQLFTAISSVR
jgi:hypothetical protein